MMKNSAPGHPLVSVILPTYNEAGNIVSLIKDIDTVVPAPKEIFVVDDNSPDGTSGIVSDYIRKSGKKYILLQTRMRDRGLTNSLRDGIAGSRGDIIVWMDCDFSMPPQIIPQLLEGIGNGYDIVAGSRFVAGGKTKKPGVNSKESGVIVGLSIWLNRIVSLIFGYDFHDYTSGFIAVKRQVTDAIPLTGAYGEYFIDFIIHAFRKGYRIKEVPYVCVPRIWGESKTGGTSVQVIKRGIGYLGTLGKLYLEQFESKKAYDHPAAE